MLKINDKDYKKTSTCHVPVNTGSPCKDYGNDAST